jgi:hypothetical protein
MSSDAADKFRKQPVIESLFEGQKWGSISGNGWICLSNKIFNEINRDICLLQTCSKGYLALICHCLLCGLGGCWKILWIVEMAESDLGGHLNEQANREQKKKSELVDHLNQNRG